MCGRFTITSPAKQISELFDRYELSIESDFEPRFNVAPTQQVPVARFDPAFGVRVTAMRWGLIPSWTQPGKSPPVLINARCETVAEKPSFRSAFKKRRCLVPADGYFEWKKSGSSKQPYWIHRPDKAPFVFAGLWETWNNDHGEVIESCTIVTTQASASMQELHDRMPVIVPTESHALWFDLSTSPTELEAIFQPLHDGWLEYVAVGNGVGNSRHDSPDCIQPA